MSLEEARAYFFGFITLPTLFALTAVAYGATRDIRRWHRGRIQGRKRVIVTMRCWDCDWEFDDYSAGICRKMLRSHRTSGRCPGGTNDD